jgi:hypothetical protein
MGLEPGDGNGRRLSGFSFGLLVRITGIHPPVHLHGGVWRRLDLKGNPESG